MSNNSNSLEPSRRAARGEVLVIGAGVIGLTSAICMKEAGFCVSVIAHELPRQSTSAAAGAIWGPYELEPFDQVDRWGRATLKEFEDIASRMNSGVRLSSGRQMSRRVIEPPVWGRHLPCFEEIPAECLIEPFRIGWQFVAPLLDMPRYLDYLLGRFQAEGGVIWQEKVDRIPLGRRGSIIVNCTGIGASCLVPDPTVQPIRGQSVVVTNPGISEFFVEMRGTNARQLYILPHFDNVVLGGTFEEGRGDLIADPAEAERIIEECTQIEPTLRKAEIIEHRVGLRPKRPNVRFDMIRQNESIVFHNYGHGGAGVSTSWGCAREMTAIIMKAAVF